MEVITIESEAFLLIQKQLAEIIAGIEKQHRLHPLPETWLDNNDVARLLKISKRTLQSYRDQGDISFSQIGAKIYYRASDINKFLEKHYKSAFRRKP